MIVVTQHKLHNNYLPSSWPTLFFIVLYATWALNDTFTDVNVMYDKIEVKFWYPNSKMGIFFQKCQKILSIISRNLHSIDKYHSQKFDGGNDKKGSRKASTMNCTMEYRYEDRFQHVSGWCWGIIETLHNFSPSYDKFNMLKIKVTENSKSYRDFPAIGEVLFIRMPINKEFGRDRIIVSE